MVERYGVCEGFSIPSNRNSRNTSVVWNDILRVWCSDSLIGIRLDQGVCTYLGDGGSAFFWTDRWASDVPLKELFPEPFLLAGMGLPGAGL